VIRSLATPRKRATRRFFRNELVAALVILQRATSRAKIAGLLGGRDGSARNSSPSYCATPSIFSRPAAPIWTKSWTCSLPSPIISAKAAEAQDCRGLEVTIPAGFDIPQEPPPFADWTGVA